MCISFEPKQIPRARDYPRHGIVEDYPHGWDDHFQCPKCAEESLRKNLELLRKQVEAEEFLR